jgi:hypothetical protein
MMLGKRAYGQETSSQSSSNVTNGQLPAFLEQMLKRNETL